MLQDRGSVSYSRSGIFSLDKDGYVVANNGARLQGYAANSGGVVNGVLGDIQIQVANQPPRLTNQISSILNLDARQLVLQEQGLQLVANGLAVGGATSGIIDSTRSTLASAGQPTNGGTPAQVAFGNATTAAAFGGETLTVDLGDGTGPQTITLPAIGASDTEANKVQAIQTAINDSIGTEQLRVSVNGAGNIVLQRAGLNATNGTSFTVDNGWNGALGANTGVVPGTAGQLLFVGAGALTADFRSIPGTQTTTRTTSTPPLNIVSYNPGQQARLTGTVPPALDFSGSNTLNFRIATGANNYDIALNNGNVNAPYSGAEIEAAINAQLPPAAQVSASVDGAGRIQLEVVTPGIPVQIGLNAGSTYSLDALGFLADNRIDSGSPVIQANNEFRLQVTSTTGNASAAYNIVIPPANYASLDDLAVAIQQQIDANIGANGLAGKVSVDAVGGQLVFTNTKPGSGERIDIDGSTNANTAFALDALGLNEANLFPVYGADPVDRSNSFRINLTVPAPDSDNRSGSVLISLDEEFRSVQQLAAAINRQLNSQDSDSYIGVQAQAVEIEPNTVPPQYKLELRATEEGEASIISITNVSASGPDISEAQLYGLLQANPADGSLLTTGIEGVNNLYPEQRVTLTNPDGEETDILIPERSEANEIVALFNLQPGVTASAETTMTIPLSSFNSPSSDMRLTVNGQQLNSTSLPDIADEINALRSSTLPGFRASVADNGDLIITNQIGRDIKLAMSSPVVTDSLVVQGAANTGPVVLGGTATADRAAAVGGVVTFIFNEGYALSDPQPAVAGIFGALTPEEFTPFTLNAFDPLDQDTYNQSTSLKIYDSLGNSYMMTQYFVKEPLDPSRPNEQNIWAMYVQVDGYDVGDPDSSLPFPQNLEPTRARFELFFNQDGSLDTTATGDMFITNWDPRDAEGNPSGALGSVNVLEGGLPLTEPASNSNFRIDLAGTTQFGSAFAVNEVNQNGYSTGRLTGLEVDQEGIIFARFTNGQAQTLGQVALANFRNPEGLTPLGDTAWGESFESGVATIGSPRTASFGQITSSALEDSNVELSEQLVRLIIAQRNYQASAKIIDTANQVTQAILNI